MYAYVANDPVNAKDPSGEFAFLIPVAVWAVKAAAIGAATSVAIEAGTLVAMCSDTGSGGGGSSTSSVFAGGGLSSDVNAGPNGSNGVNGNLANSNQNNNDKEQCSINGHSVSPDDRIDFEAIDSTVATFYGGIQVIEGTYRIGTDIVGGFLMVGPAWGAEASVSLITGSVSARSLTSSISSTLNLNGSIPWLGSGGLSFDRSSTWAGRSYGTGGFGAGGSVSYTFNIGGP